MLYTAFKRLIIEDGYTEKLQVEISRHLVTDNYAKFFAAKHMFFFNWLDKFYSAFNIGLSSVKQIEVTLNQHLKTNRHLHITDCLVRSCDYSMGVMSARNPVFLYLADGRLVKLEEQKPDFDLYFKYERGLSPGFHVYYLPQYDNDRDMFYTCNQEDLISTLVEHCCDCFANTLLAKGADANAS